MASVRIDRVNSEIKKVVSKIILEDINDPRITGIVSVSNVKTSSDFSYCKIFISIFGDNKKQTFEAIKSAGSFIRKSLSKAVKIKTVPELIFVLDDGVDYSEHINKLIDNLDIPAESEEDESSN